MSQVRGFSKSKDDTTWLLKQEERAKITVDYLNENGCLPLKVAKVEFFDRLEMYAADARYSSEAIGIFVRNFFNSLNGK